MWVLDHLDDIDSDMSAFHRVDDARTTLPAPLYFARAQRLGAYTGVMQARIIEQQKDKDGGAPSVGVGGHQHGPATQVSDDVMIERLANEGWVERD